MSDGSGGRTDPADQPGRADALPSIAAVGAYAPPLRIDADEIESALGRFQAPGIDEKAVPEADEDALTMAYEAARRALDAADADGDDVVHLAFATTTPPMSEEDLTARLASFLGAPGEVSTRTFTGSTRAGGQALDAAVEAGPWSDGVGIVIASDCPNGAPDSAIEHAAGAGAVALVLDLDGAGDVVERASHVDPYPGTRFRGRGEDETEALGIGGYDRATFTDVLESAAARIDVDPSSFDVAAVQAPNGKLPYRATDALGVDAETIAAVETVSALGDTGAASAFLGLASAAEDGGDRVLLATWGSGAGANLLVLDGIGSVPVESALDASGELTYPEYLRRRGVLSSGEPDGGGAYVSVPSWQRTIPQRHRLVAGDCPNCSSLVFPPDGACAECGERAESYERVELPGTGRVEATTTIGQGGAPPEFLDQQHRSGPYVSAIVAIDGPDEDDDRSVSAPMQVLSPEDREVTVGSPVETTIRRIYEQEGVIRYGQKARLVD
ncbi:acyl carrier protein synthase [Salinarchaeum sp. Harcht-Bsk1]|uniref:zinc ribbon domain-containing protein n=1 Tax=Salinarchaeum sp. Harcht-Bsk1 TaxID=1333523 RepID=UPI0003424740|nr:zinc ribbon domain-containing protein [Salinarchaeum sp. Harcht-Bsk1]AGN00441.1 acyl carrier protein synthase [Salinarchaeum sp. Harcht-Bsk1]